MGDFASPGIVTVYDELLYKYKQTVNNINDSIKLNNLDQVKNIMEELNEQGSKHVINRIELRDVIALDNINIEIIKYLVDKYYIHRDGMLLFIKYLNNALIQAVLIERLDIADYLVTEIYKYNTHNVIFDSVTYSVIGPKNQSIYDYKKDFNNVKILAQTKLKEYKTKSKTPANE
jgi:hypothetical protein